LIFLYVKVRRDPTKRTKQNLEENNMWALDVVEKRAKVFGTPWVPHPFLKRLQQEI